MSSRILVTYASRAGSTAGVAEAVGRTLAEGGAQVDMRPMNEVNDLAPYDAVVAGSAIQPKQRLPEAVAFMRCNQAALAMHNGERYRPMVADFLRPVRSLIRPACKGYFAGALDISRVPTLADWLKFRLSALSGVWSEGDHRNWPAIQAWAERLPPLSLPEG